MEEKLAKFAAFAVGASYLVAGLFIFSVICLAKIMTNGLVAFLDMFIAKVFFISLLYIISVVLLYTLKGKGTKRRLITWTYSIAFHAGLLLYLGAITGFGWTILVIGLAEVLSLMLCTAGLIILIYDQYQASRV